MRYKGERTPLKKAAPGPPKGPAKHAGGRPRHTAKDSAPVTFHISRQVYDRARIARINAGEKRPLSAIVEQFLDAWSTARSI